MDKSSYNCPNCGAPVKADVCEYCGTQLKSRENCRKDFKIDILLDNVCKETIASGFYRNFLSVNEARRLLL